MSPELNEACALALGWKRGDAGAWTSPRSGVQWAALPDFATDTIALSDMLTWLLQHRELVCLFDEGDLIKRTYRYSAKIGKVEGEGPTVGWAVANLLLKVATKPIDRFDTDYGPMVRIEPSTDGPFCTVHSYHKGKRTADCGKPAVWRWELRPPRRYCGALVTATYWCDEHARSAFEALR